VGNWRHQSTARGRLRDKVVGVESFHEGAVVDGCQNRGSVVLGIEESESVSGCVAVSWDDLKIYRGRDEGSVGVRRRYIIIVT
jgi:hypothetical protein